MNPEVTQYVQQLQSWQKDICEALRQMILKVLPQAEERLQYGKPHYLKNGQYACVISVAKDKVSFMLFNAADLVDIKGFFTATSNPERKTATIKQGQEVDYKLLAGLLKQASKSL